MGMEFHRVRDVFVTREGDEVALRGWVFRIRKTGGLIFVLLRDATGLVQVVVNRTEVPGEEFDALEKALVESAIEVSGKVKEEKKAPGGREVHATRVNVISYAERFPIFKDQSEEFLLDNRHLWIRSRHIVEATKVKAEILRAAREWLREHEFIEVTAPELTPNMVEGGATLFELDYFEGKAYLGQSAQLYLEAMLFPLEKVYTITHSFRAEKSRTRRHLTEFTHLEAEEAWADNTKNMQTQEEMIAYICHQVARNARNSLLELGRDPQTLLEIETPFKKITYDDAAKTLDERLEHGFQYGNDFGAVEEETLTREETHPIFIYNYPVSAKSAFYMKVHPEDSSKVLCADLLAPEGYGEIIGGSERETDIPLLMKRLETQGENIKNYEWYLDLRRYGSVPHAGWGLGIERLARWICKLEHIRDATPFPRTPSRVYP